MQGSALVPRQRLPASLIAGRVLLLLAFVSGVASVADAQGEPDFQPTQDGSDSPVKYHVTKPIARLDMAISTSRVLVMKGESIRRVAVTDESIVQATPLAPDQIQITALARGVAQVNLWDRQGRIRTVDVVVKPDPAELQRMLTDAFPEAKLQVRALGEGVHITGDVPRPEMVYEIVAYAQTYFEKVINGLVVRSVQQVALHVKVIEVSRTKLRQLGLDWQFMGDDGVLTQGAAGLFGQDLPVGTGADTVRFAVFGDVSAFLGYLQALRSQELVKILSEPTLVTMTGQKAKFLSGGSFPIIVPTTFGNSTVEWREYGTQVEFTPIVRGDGTIRIEVNGNVSELDASRGAELGGTRVPGVTERSVETSVELKAGQSLALAGLMQNRVESLNRGVPVLADLPLLGRFFSRVEEKANEVELLVIVTPELIAPLDSHQVPDCGPGQLTVSPSDKELYCYGYLEVPNCAAIGPAPGTCAAPPGAADQAGLMPGTPPAAHAVPQAVGPGRMEAVPTPRPATPEMPNNTAQPPNAGLVPRSDAPSPPRASDAGRPALYGPIGYEPLP